MRRSRLLPERAAGSGCPGSITGVRLIDVSARHHERKIGVLIAQARVTRCPLRTQLGRADQPKRPLDDVLPIAEGQPVPPLGRGPVHAHQGLQPGGVDQLNCGEIDDQAYRPDRSRFKLAVKRGYGHSVKRVAEESRTQTQDPAREHCRGARAAARDRTGGGACRCARGRNMSCVTSTALEGCAGSRRLPNCRPVDLRSTTLDNGYYDFLPGNHMIFADPTNVAA
jgi:hypothetical protein